MPPTERYVGPPRAVAAAEPGRYELHVSGLDPAMLACAFPEAAGVSTGDVSVLAGAFDARSLAALIRRVNLLGGRALALFAPLTCQPADRAAERAATPSLTVARVKRPRAGAYAGRNVAPMATLRRVDGVAARRELLGDGEQVR